ncbi:DNA repair protein RecO [Gilvimarinus agarilyticus]|uniref:DNA repair protein RecO n=1 Tax=Gilvimarinus agarilyticus TaxID=679259 RepID=UPI0005A1D3AB|nr:DNA repair protein RecO [Gilvimarinus agarilyticus]
MQRVELQPAFVVHARPYRDTSFLVDFFTPDYGRLCAVARGARRGKNSQRPLLNPFIPLLISFQGKDSLQLLLSLESTGHGLPLTGNRLFSGLYLNELLRRVLSEWDSCPHLFEYYTEALRALAGDQDVEVVLRRFERQLLQELGYAIDWHCEAHTGSPLMADAWYRLEPQEGFIESAPDERGRYYLGANLIAIAEDSYELAETKRAAKHISRTLLQPLLGDQPLKSRQLFL